MGKGSLVTSKARYTGWMIRRKTGLRRRNKLGIKKGRKTRLRGKISPRDVKLWSLTRADSEFSTFIRRRDGKCIRCGRLNYLQNSHFWSRSHKSVRYDVDNCDTLCYPCHYGNAKGWEYEKNGEYMEFKKNQLGSERYSALELRAHLMVKQEEAIKLCMNFLNPKDTSPGEE